MVPINAIKTIGVDTDAHGDKVIWHGGAIEGFSTYIVSVPVEKLAIIVLSNVEGPAAHDIGTDILKITRHEFSSPKR